MNLIKRIILILSVFCVAMPVRAMDAGVGVLDSLKAAIVGTAAGIVTYCVFIKGLEYVGIFSEHWLDSLEDGYKVYSPLHWAILYDKSAEKVKLLLAQGANVEAKNLEGLNALVLAAKKGHVDIVRTILHHAPFDPRRQFVYPISPASMIIRPMLGQPPFDIINDPTREPIKPADHTSFARVLETLRIGKINNLPCDLRTKILAYLPEDALNQEQCRLMYNTCSNVPELVAQCPFEWFLRTYDAIYGNLKSEFLNIIVPAITEYRMSKIRELLANPKLQELDPATTDHVILAMLDVTNVEQHRTTIEQNVRDAFTHRVFQKHPALKLINVNQGVQDVMKQ